MSLRDEPTVDELIAARERADAGNRRAFPMLFDGLGSDLPAPPPSLEAIEGWVRQHRDRHALSAVTYARLDAALENIEEVRREK